MSGISSRKQNKILYSPQTKPSMDKLHIFLFLSQKQVTYTWGSLIIESLLPRAIMLQINIISKVFGNSEAK